MTATTKKKAEKPKCKKIFVDESDHSYAIAETPKLVTNRACATKDTNTEVRCFFKKNILFQNKPSIFDGYFKKRSSYLHDRVLIARLY